MKKYIITFVIIISYLLITPVYADEIAQENNQLSFTSDAILGSESNFISFPSKYDIQNDKVWTVKFNKTINSNTVNSDTIYIENSKGNKLNQNIKVLDDKVMIYPPVGNYTNGEIYTLYITTKIKSANGYTLKQGAKMDFTITVGDLTLTLGNNKKISTGWSSGKLIEELGNPARKDISINGLEWYVYNQDYSNFVMVAMENDTVCGFYTLSKNFKLSNGISYNCDKYIEYDNSNDYIKLYVDKHNQDKVYGVLVILGGNYNPNNLTMVEYLQVQSKEIFDATNAFRVNYGAEALEWNTYVARAAQMHSQDMADNNYFDHYSLDGRTPKQRIRKELEESGDSYISGYGENIVKVPGFLYGVDAFSWWVNSEGHRRNMLTKYYNYLGVGGGYRDIFENGIYIYSECYYTQDFIAK